MSKVTVDPPRRGLEPGKNAVLYTTMKAINNNPIGDGRHNRAPYRSSLEKNHIPAGFVFAVDEAGNIEDRSRPYEVIDASRGGALRELLLAVASEPLKGPVEIEESVEDVVASLPKTQGATTMILKALGLTGTQLRLLLQEQASQRQAQSAASP